MKKKRKRVAGGRGGLTRKLRGFRTDDHGKCKRAKEWGDELSVVVAKSVVKGYYGSIGS